MTYVRTHRHLLLLLLASVVGIILLAVVLMPVLTPYSLYEMRTTSMVPRIPVGSIAVVDRSLTHAVPGHIIAFHPPGDPLQTFTHTVVHVSRGGAYTTRGLANIYADPWTVPPRDTVGTVIKIYPWLGWAISTLTAAALLSLGAFLIYAVLHWAFHARVDGRFLVLTVLALTCIYLIDVERPLVNANVEFTAISRTSASVHVINSGWIPVRAIVPHEHDQVSTAFAANAAGDWTFHRFNESLKGTVAVMVEPAPTLLDWIVFLCILLMPFGLVLWNRKH